MVAVCGRGLLCRWAWMLLKAGLWWALSSCFGCGWRDGAFSCNGRGCCWRALAAQGGRGGNRDISMMANTTEKMIPTGTGGSRSVGGSLFVWWLCVVGFFYALGHGCCCKQAYGRHCLRALAVGGGAGPSVAMGVDIGGGRRPRQDLANARSVRNSGGWSPPNLLHPLGLDKGGAPQFATPHRPRRDLGEVCSVRNS